MILDLQLLLIISHLYVTAMHASLLLLTVADRTLVILSGSISLQKQAQVISHHIFKAFIQIHVVSYGMNSEENKHIN